MNPLTSIAADWRCPSRAPITDALSFYTTVLNWSYRLGLAVLQRPLPRRDDWIFILDQTIALGEYKCLVVLGIPASRLSEVGYSPHHGDMSVLAVEITARSTGLWVEAVLQRVAARTGKPVQIVSDSVRTLDVEQWVETHLGDSMLKRRRQALKAT